MPQYEGSIYRMLATDHHKLSNAMSLRYEVKALKDTTGDKGLVTSTLVFGVIPTLRNTNASLQDQAERLEGMRSAR